MNHSRSTLVLMEQIIMVLVFALAAALCVQVFVYASLQSRENDERDRAVELAQSAAETLKHAGGDVAQAQNAAVARFGGQIDQEECWRVYYDENWQEQPESDGHVYRLSAQAAPTEVEGLCAAEILVERYGEKQEDEVLFALTVAWQEVDAHD